MRNLGHSSHFILTMPPKRTTDVWKANIAKARETLEHPETQSDLASALAVSQQNLANAKTQDTGDFSGTCS